MHVFPTIVLALPDAGFFKGFCHGANMTVFRLTLALNQPHITNYGQIFHHTDMGRTNGRFLRWFVSSGPENFPEVKAPVSELWRYPAEFYAEKGHICCVRRIQDKQSKPATLLTTSKELYGSLNR